MSENIPALIAAAREYIVQFGYRNTLIGRLADALESLSASPGDDEREARSDQAVRIRAAVADHIRGWYQVARNPEALVDEIAPIWEAELRSIERGFRRPSPLTQEALWKLIWDTSHADEGTISATGANIIAAAILSRFSLPEPAEDEWEYGRRGDFGDGVERVMLDSQAEALGGVTGGVPMRRSAAVPPGPWLPVEEGTK